MSVIIVNARTPLSAPMNPDTEGTETLVHQMLCKEILFRNFGLDSRTSQLATRSIINLNHIDKTLILSNEMKWAGQDLVGIQQMSVDDSVADV